MIKVKKIIFKIKEFIKKGFLSIFRDVVSVRVIYIFFFIAILLLSKYLYYFSLDITLLIAKIVPDSCHDNKVIQFIMIFTPIILLSYIISRFIRKFSFRTFRYFLITIYLFVEVFLIDITSLNISDFIYFYITLETLIYFVSNEINKKGEKNGKV